jgi:hypothetical protein
MTDLTPWLLYLRERAAGTRSLGGWAAEQVLREVRGGFEIFLESLYF